MAKRYFAYLLLFEGGYLYTGSTGTLDRRVRKHGRERASVIWKESHASREAAAQRELQLKGWSRAKKLALAAGDFESLHRLAKRRGGDLKSL